MQLCSIAYHLANSAGSFRRKSAARSMTLTPASSSSRACAIATPCGVAKNTTSQAFRSVSSGVEKAISTRPRSDGNISATFIPASLREVTAVTLAEGWLANRRKSSTPVYPVPPTIPTLIMLRS
ncbi:hypothetical protein D3C85_1518560 [compost metagenome]